MWKWIVRMWSGSGQGGDLEKMRWYQSIYYTKLVFAESFTLIKHSDGGQINLTIHIKRGPKGRAASIQWGSTFYSTHCREHRKFITFPKPELVRTQPSQNSIRNRTGSSHLSYQSLSNNRTSNLANLKNRPDPEHVRVRFTTKWNIKNKWHHIQFELVPLLWLKSVIIIGHKCSLVRVVSTYQFNYQQGYQMWIFSCQMLQFWAR